MSPVLVNNGLPVLLTAVELLVGDLNLYEVPSEVHVNLVPIPDEGDRGTIKGFRAEVADGEAARSPGEATVGDDG